MAKPVRLIVALTVVLLIAAPTAAAQRTFRHNLDTIFAPVGLACALDYTNSSETRMIVTNNSGQTVVAGSKLSWTTDASRGAFYLNRNIDAGHVFSFGLNAKGQNCTVSVTRPAPQLTQ